MFRLLGDILVVQATKHLKVQYITQQSLCNVPLVGRFSRGASNKTLKNAVYNITEVIEKQCKSRS